MRTVTFTMEDALISPIGLSILAGAGLIEAREGKPVVQHIAEQTRCIENYFVTTGTAPNQTTTNYIVAFVDQKPKTSNDPSIYVMILDDHGEVQSEPYLFLGLKEADYNNTSILKRVTSEGIAATTDESVSDAQGAGRLYYGLVAGGTHDGAYNVILYGEEDKGSNQNPRYVDSPLKGQIFRTYNTATATYTNAYEKKYPIYFDDHKFIYDSTKLQQWYYDDNAGDSHSGKNSDASTYKTRLTLANTAGADTKSILVDYYTDHESGAFEITITPDKFGGTYYLEASTLWRDQGTGQDLPAEFIIPNCKVQSNFSFTLSSSGDPSSFTFTMDAFPDYTRWDLDEKVFARIQVIGASTTGVNEAYREQTWAHPDYEPVGGIVQGAFGEAITNP